jgi:two-component system response regulator
VTEDKVILLVEDNARDEALTLRALAMNKIVNNITVVRDGAEALDYLFGTGAYADRDMSVVPQVVLLDLKLPKVDGLEVLRRMRSDPRTARLPVVIFTSSSEEEDVISSYSLGANSYVRKPVDFEHFLEATKQVGLYWLVINQAAPRTSRK